MNAYDVTLLVHSWLRWVLLVLVVGRIGLALMDRARGRPYDKRARVSSAITVGTLDLMVLLGVVLLGWLSPFTSAAMADMGAAMKDPLRRFWLVEHPTTMFIAAIVAHVGTSVAKRSADPRRAHLAAAIGLTMALLAIAAAIPWPFRAAIARPLFMF